jgi:hypothetical protein
MENIGEDRVRAEIENIVADIMGLSQKGSLFC